MSHDREEIAAAASSVGPRLSASASVEELMAWMRIVNNGPIAYDEQLAAGEDPDLPTKDELWDEIASTVGPDEDEDERPELVRGRLARP